MLLIPNLTVWSQCIDHKYSFSDGCKIYTKEQRKDCIKCYIDLKWSDSVIKVQSIAIESFDNRVEGFNEALNISKAKHTKMKKKRNRAYLYGGLASIITFVLGVLMF